MILWIESEGVDCLISPITQNCHHTKPTSPQHLDDGILIGRSHDSLPPQRVQQHQLPGLPVTGPRPFDRAHHQRQEQHHRTVPPHRGGDHVLRTAPTFLLSTCRTRRLSCIRRRRHRRKSSKEDGTRNEPAGFGFE